MLTYCHGTSLLMQSVLAGQFPVLKEDSLFFIRSTFSATAEGRADETIAQIYSRGRTITKPHSFF